MEYTSKSQGNLNTVLGAVGTGLGLMSGGLSLSGGTVGVRSNETVSRYEFDMQMGYEKQLQDQALQIANLQAEKISDAKDVQLYTQLKADMNKLEDKLESRIGACEGAIQAQTVWNATQQSAIGCINNQIEQLYSLTKLVIPNASVSPGWAS